MGKRDNLNLMRWCNDLEEEVVIANQDDNISTLTCPSCGHHIQYYDQGGIHELPGLPAGVKFDPTDNEILEHLEAKVKSDKRKLHPLIDEFIPTLEGENGICYTHPQKLPGVSKDGQLRHFFHRPSKAYTTGTRKRRKVHTEEDGSETRWHKTGKTRAVFGDDKTIKGFKKILVLYTNYGRQRKPEKTNWVMHQYHLGNNEEEKDGELVLSKVFYQTQPRQCSGSNKEEDSSSSLQVKDAIAMHNKSNGLIEYYNSSSSPTFINSFDDGDGDGETPPQLIPNLVNVQGGHVVSPFVRIASDTSEDRHG